MHEKEDKHSIKRTGRKEEGEGTMLRNMFAIVSNVLIRSENL